MYEDKDEDNKDWDENEKEDQDEKEDKKEDEDVEEEDNHEEEDKEQDKYQDEDQDEDQDEEEDKEEDSSRQIMSGKPSRYYSTVLILCKPLQKLKNGKLTIYLFIFYSYLLKFHKILSYFFCRPERVKTT